MQMLDSRGGNEGDGSYGGDNEYNDAGNSNYDAPASKAAYTPPPSYSKPAPARMPENNLPEIDINEDEIPF
jgi:single-stranded DNA-binding protein